MSDDVSPLGEALEDALDDADEELLLVQPQFERNDGIEPSDPPVTSEAIEQLRTCSRNELREMGLRKWSDESGLWLLPYEWHDQVPEDYPFLTIMGRRETRAEYPENPDKRFGVLSFGIVPEFEEPVDSDGDEETERSVEVVDDA